MTYRAFGDSIINGAGASSPAARFISKLNVSLGIEVKNISVPGSMVMDQEAAVYGEEFLPGDITLHCFGANDQAKYLLDSGKRGYFIDGLRAYAILSSAKTYAARPENGVTFTGAWSSSYSYGTYGSVTPGAKATFVADGDAICLGMMRQTGNTSTFRVIVDGQSKGVFASGGDVTTVKGKPYGPMGLCFKNLGEGQHTVEIQVVSTDGFYPVYFRFFSACEPQATAVILSVPRAVAYIGGGSDANVSAYNSAISALVKELQTIGLKVLFVDVTSLLKTDDMHDDVHPSDSGHMKYYAAISAQLLDPSVVLKLASVFTDYLGNMYIATAEGVRKLSTD
ncbi:hypothetical protein PS619_00117 [Pseudomonas fluorescens]|nr:hypothetical protein PS619_00117 [Pseudomonas fluorescens]